ncbi:hypothetical protein FRC11_006390 [Ceratobasidium sp. 423]|nr:hypothetical protein FRC11_006390 [Ceratobasidium sp. 423]
MSGSAKHTELDRDQELDPDTLSGTDQVAFYDLKEHEDCYNVLMSTRFDCSSLTFTQSLVLTNTSVDTSVESIINALPSKNHTTQKFVYRLNAMKLLLNYVKRTQCTHPALVAQWEGLITAVAVEIEDLVQNAMKQWVTYDTGETKRDGLRTVHPAIIHCIMGVSREPCNFILSSLKAILSLAANMQDAQAQQFMQQHLSHAPNTLATTLHFLNLPPPLQFYIICSHCLTLYHELDHMQLLETCTTRNLDGVGQ